MDGKGATSGRGILFILSAPSGAGKTTLAKLAISKIPGLKQSVSYTTRARREGEVDGKSYNFVDKAAFQKMIGQNRFIEWAQVHGEYYGTALDAIEKAKAEKSDILLVIDVQGAAKLREKKVDGVFIFVLPPSLAVLHERLGIRGTEDVREREKRMETARNEIAASKDYDFLVINDTLDAAEQEMEYIIRAERCRLKRRSLDFPDYTPHS
ncbi:MAG: guanylate kinase [Nitrospinae bacterium]|nr:guanylate kinase [Nitrospinota bacterium]